MLLQRQALGCACKWTSHNPVHMGLTVLYHLCGMTLLRPHNVMWFQPHLVGGTIQDDSALL